MHHARRAPEIQSLRRDVGDHQTLRPVAAVVPEPVEHRRAGRGRVAEAGAVARAPGDERWAQAVAQKADRFAVAHEDERRTAIGQKLSEPHGLGVGYGLERGGGEQLVDPLQVLEREIARVRSGGEQLPEHELLLELAGERPELRAAETAPGPPGIARVKQQMAIPAERARERWRAGRERANQNRPEDRGGGRMDRETETREQLDRAGRGRILVLGRFGGGCRSSRTRARNRRVLQNELAERGGRPTAGQHPADRRDAIGEERVVASAEQELMSEIVHPVDDGRRAEQQHRTAHQPCCHVQVPVGALIPEVMAFVDDHEPAANLGQPAAAGLLVRADLHRHADTRRDRSPLIGKRCRNEAGNRPSRLPKRRGCERNVGLAAPDWVGEQCGSVAIQRGQHPPDTSGLARQHPRGCLHGALGGCQASGEGPRDGRGVRRGSRAQTRPKWVGDVRERLSDDPRGVRPPAGGARDGLYR